MKFSCKCAAGVDSKDPMSDHLHAETTRPTPLHGRHISSRHECISGAAQSGQWFCRLMSDTWKWILVFKSSPWLYSHTQRILLTNAVIFIPVAALSKAWVYGRSLLGLWVRIPRWVWMSVFCECCVLSGRGLCDGLITRPEESYRVWCV
jgi:hypothetical protein